MSTMHNQSGKVGDGYGKPFAVYCGVVLAFVLAVAAFVGVAGLLAR